MIKKIKRFLLPALRGSFKKKLNLLLVYFSMFLKTRRVWGKPLSLMIEPTNACNLQCPTCPTGNRTDKRPKGFLRLEEFKKILDELGDYLFKITLWNYGEPFINRQLVEMIELAKKKDIFIVTSTNGHFFSRKGDVERLIRSGLDELIICLDGASQETLSKFRKNCDFEEIVAGIRSVVEEKRAQKSKTPKVVIQFIVMSHNEHEIELVRDLYEDLGADELSIKSVGISSDERFRELLPKDPKYSRYQHGEGTIRLKEASRGCSLIYKNPVINWNGDIVPCCYDLYSKHIFGNCFEEGGIDRVWNNARTTRFRKTINSDKNSIEMCRICPESALSK